MAPIKFEDNLKETLEKRTIQPSNDAWNKLEARLDKSSSEKTKKSFWFWGVAASIVGILLVSTILLKKDIQPIQENSIVTSQKGDNTTDSTANAKVENPTPQEPLEEAINQPLIQVATQEKEKPEPKQISGIKEQSKTEIASEIPQKQIQENILQPYEEIKLNKVVAHVKELVEKNKTVTEHEIDSLLKIAQQDINNHKTYKETTGKVDAMALLQDVENDLDKSFRDKVFDALYSGIEDITTAIVQRNE